ncbi:hypothetical protein PITCH_A600003 [uncultured Desulfobacterium sp.]|uniref:Uncharacterized protein n=1 Tax=uncultured Desulfobacterium sp. TaxID=201089 RepID=A0A445N1A0_9BACT|nr:hypothetical protein PITCH_A600003 [uncultured Desulfobacterium sp.]
MTTTYWGHPHKCAMPQKYFDPQEIMAPGKLVADGEGLKLI